MPSSDPSADEALEFIGNLLKRQAPLSEAQIALRQLELENQRQQQQQSHDYSMATLQAQLDDRADQRGVEQSASRWGATVLVVILLIFASFFFYALHQNKDALVMEVLKLVTTFTAGLAGGYGWKAAQVNKVKPEEPK